MARSSLVLDLARQVARLPFSQRFIGWFFAHLSFLLPVHRLYESKNLLAFWHPAPSYHFHILIVPKKAIIDPGRLNDDDSQWMMELFQVTQKLVLKFNLDKVGYRLILNGGKYQDMPQLHFHLVSDQLPEV